ncbi:MAG: hypothetical protein U5O69_03990 [Candidatus Competibacteraceae bacterium]|nr:hypothetical protein [Candidatus Competibacteraceae bacterium]
MVLESGSEFIPELVLSFLNLAKHLLVLHQQRIGIVAFLFGGVRVLDVQVVDGPVVAVAGGLFVLGLLAQFSDLLGSGAESCPSTCSRTASFSRP